MQLCDLEKLLRAHPGVRNAAVISCRTPEGQERLVGYIVPNDGYLESVAAVNEEERSRLQKWRKTFDLTQFAKEAKSAEPGFNIAGWNSSYTRQPIPAQEMREWVECTVKDILSFQPEETLEVGCGTGLLLSRIAPNCRRYFAADFSPAVLAKLRKQLEQLEGPWEVVTLQERSADNLEGLEENRFDTAIMNSLVQYFPSASYLERVLEGLVRVVRPGGRIFIGDARSLPLLEAYAISVELYQAPPAMTLMELRRRIARRIGQQEELLISPAFFLALEKRFAKIARVHVHPKRGRFENEMTRFRFNAVLYLDSKHESLFTPNWQDWNQQRFTSQSIPALLQERRPKNLAIKNIPNARIDQEIRALAELSTAEPTGTVGAFKAALQNTKSAGIHPEDACSLGEELGYQVDLSWANSRPDGCYDLVFRQLPPSGEPIREAVAWPQLSNLGDDLGKYTNIPGKTALRERLLQELRGQCAQECPQSTAPLSFVLLDSLPLTHSGEIDLEALPRPDDAGG
jgi:ubiquinone/menaquinone biosynthesis C-methylase UbiE